MAKPVGQITCAQRTISMVRLPSVLAGSLLLVSHLFSVVANGAISIEPFVQYTIRDSTPKDGVADRLRPSHEPGYIGQITGPGPASFEEETFLEFDLRPFGPQRKAMLNLRFFYSDIENGTGKSLSISTYTATGSATLASYKTGNLLSELSLSSIPSPGAESKVSLDVTDIVNQFIQSDEDFLGLRFHDAVYNPGSPLLGVSTAQVALGHGFGALPQYLVLEAVPESPSIAIVALYGAAALLFGRCRRRRQVKKTCRYFSIPATYPPDRSPLTTSPPVRLSC